MLIFYRNSPYVTVKLQLELKLNKLAMIELKFLVQKELPYINSYINMYGKIALKLNLLLLLYAVHASLLCNFFVAS